MTQEDRIKFTKRVQEMKELICGIVIKNQNEAQRRADKYYLMISSNYQSTCGFRSITLELHLQKGTSRITEN